MLKSLIFELLKSSMEQEKKSYGKPFVYFFNVLGLALIIAANYLYVANAVKFCSLMNIGIASIVISIIIEAVRCYLKYKNRYRTINMLRDKSRNLVDGVSDQFADLIPNKTLIKYLPTIIRYVPTTMLTFLIGVYIKRKFAKKWDSKYPVISDIWIRNWSGIVPFFAFPKEIRKVIYTTNTIESVNRQIRKIIKNKGVFPDDKSITKIVYLALKHAAKKWTMPIKEWSLALNQFEILCGNFKYELLENDF